ncbi:MAG TPA: endolytic transglycosylase MltG, partial [Blastocatellia bacterium]
MFVLIILALIGVAASWWWIKREVNTRIEHGSSDKIITVGQGMGRQATIRQLSDAQIVRSPLALKIYLYVTGRGGKLKAGDYRFDSPISALEAIEKIERGDVAFERVTIPEGLNRFEIAERLANETGKATAKEFLRLMNDPSLVAKLDPRARNLEGYLFPDTYNYISSTTPEELVRAMVNRFNEVLTPEWRARAAQVGLSIHEAITIASLVEEEARVPDDRAKIASVFMNRL